MSIPGLKDYYRVTTTVRLSTDFYDASTEGLPPAKQLDQHIFTTREDILSVAPELKPIIDIIDENEIFGKIGNYTSVIHGSLVFEGFTALDGARKEAGGTGKDSIVPSLKLEILIPVECDKETLTKFLNALHKKHPWETPVIEVNPTTLWTPPSAESN